jgi:hypothetical protein
LFFATLVIAIGTFDFEEIDFTLSFDMTNFVVILLYIFKATALTVVFYFINLTAVYAVRVKGVDNLFQSPSLFNP